MYGPKFNLRFGKEQLITLFNIFIIGNFNNSVLFLRPLKSTFLFDCLSIGKNSFTFFLKNSNPSFILFNLFILEIKFLLSIIFNKILIY